VKNAEKKAAKDAKRAAIEAKAAAAAAEKAKAEISGANSLWLQTID
jgi:hypothetical protein